MKKAGIVVVILLIAGMCFANGTKERAPVSLGVGASFPFEHEKSEYSGEDITSDMNAVGLDISLVQLPYKNSWGCIGNFSFAWPQSIESEYKGNKIASSASDYDNLFLYDFTISPDYFFVNNDDFYLGIGPAFNLSLFTWKLNYFTGLNYTFGLGGNVFGMYKFAPKGGLFFGVNGIYNFYTMGWIIYDDKTYNNSGTTNNFEFLPYVGVSFIF